LISVSTTSRLLITLGVILIAVGLLLPWLTKLGLGRLPGDIQVHRDGFQFYFPITTCIVVSVAASALFWFLRR
jgi:ribose/xylose/arabinose/galactoside ABC-type transport system permease subunit